MFQKANVTWWRDHDEFGDYENPDEWIKDVAAEIPASATRADWAGEIWTDKNGNDHCPICSSRIRYGHFSSGGSVQCSDGHYPSHKLA